MTLANQRSWLTLLIGVGVTIVTVPILEKFVSASHAEAARPILYANWLPYLVASQFTKESDFWRRLGVAYCIHTVFVATYILWISSKISPHEAVPVYMLLGFAALECTAMFIAVTKIFLVTVKGGTT